MTHAHHEYACLAPVDSPTFVRVPLIDRDAQGAASCCGEVSKPGVEFLTNRWNVFLHNHIPQPLFEAMMRDIYNGPKFQRFLSCYYSPAGSVCGILFCVCLSMPILLWSFNGMKAEVRKKLAVWSKVLTKEGCGVSMQIHDKYGLVFNINPNETLQTNDELVEERLLRNLGLKHYDYGSYKMAAYS